MSDNMCDDNNNNGRIMWQSVRDAACGDDVDKSYPCHMPREGLAYPDGVATALEYVLQLPQVSDNVVTIPELPQSIVRSLLNGDTLWVAHRGIDREALVTNLQAAAAIERGPGMESVAIELNLPTWKKRRD